MAGALARTTANGAGVLAMSRPPLVSPDVPSRDRPEAPPHASRHGGLPESGSMTDPSHPKVISETVDVDAPPEVVFAILSDPRQHARIDGSGSVRELVKGPERLSKGATFGMDMKLFGLPYKIRNTVVEYDENRQIAWRHFGGHRWRYVLEPTGGGTRVTESFDYSRYGLLPRLVVELAGFPKRNREGIAGTLVKLREAAESDAKGPAA